MRIKNQLCLVALICMIALSGCATEIKPDSPDSGTYSTQTSMSSLEYATYMSKQISVFSNQLSTMMLAAFNSTEAAYENDVALAEESRDIMQETLDEVIVTMPSNGKESDRETAITAMQTAIDHMEDYITKLRNGENVSDYADIFQNDFNSVTGLANLYNE